MNSSAHHCQTADTAGSGAGLRRALACVVLFATACFALEAQASGELECVMMPHSVLDLSSGVSGRLRSVGVDRADPVRAGQVLAELETAVELANLNLAAARAAMRSEVNLRVAALEFDRRRQQRMDALRAGRVISAQDQEQAERDAKLGRWQLELARDKVTIAALEVRRVEALLDLRTVRSPFDGVVLERFKSAGEYVDEQPVLRVARLDPLRIEVIAPLGMHQRFLRTRVVEVFPETDAQNAHIAQVVAVDPVADPASGTFRARLKVPNPGHRLLAGVRCTARIAQQDPATQTEDDSILPPPDIDTDVEGLPALLVNAVPVVDELLPPAAQPLRSEIDVAEVDETTSADSPGAPSVPIAHSATNDAESTGVAACHTIGPLRDEGAGMRLAVKLADANIAARLREKRHEEVIGQIVLALPSVPEETPDMLSARLREAGVRDREMLTRGPYAGRMSLGVYNGPVFANKRVRGLREKGVDAVTAPRIRTRTGWWLDVALADSVQVHGLRELMNRLDTDLIPQPRDCGPLHTAAR